MTVTSYEAIVESICNKFIIAIEDTIEEKTKQLIAEGIRTHICNEREKMKKTYLRNTKILLKHYPEFEAHVHGSITCRRELEESEYLKDKSLAEIMFASNIDEDIYIASIQRTKARTRLLLANIDVQLEHLRRYSIERGILHKYNCMQDFYIKGYAQQVIAEKYQCHSAQVSTWCNEMVDIFSRLLFGYDSLNNF